MATSTNKTAAFGVKLIYKSRATIDLLKDAFGDRLISRFGPVNWPPRPCDLTPLDYFLWGYVKSSVYVDEPQTLDHLEDNIRRVIADIRPQMLEKVIENWTSRLDYSRASRGSHMPEIIFKINGGAHRPSEERLGKTLSNGFKEYDRVANFNKWDDMMCLANVYFFLGRNCETVVCQQRRRLRFLGSV
ncbi:transposable element Tc3 transposase [Trichonephila clavipes]|nr:transposable element Tc3 transposase [Trichonephila clavipes]